MASMIVGTPLFLEIHWRGNFKGLLGFLYRGRLSFSSRRWCPHDGKLRDASLEDIQIYGWGWRSGAYGFIPVESSALFGFSYCIPSYLLNLLNRWCSSNLYLQATLFTAQHRSYRDVWAVKNVYFSDGVFELSSYCLDWVTQSCL